MDFSERVGLDVEGGVGVECSCPGVVCVILSCAEGNGGVKFGEFAKENWVVHFVVELEEFVVELFRGWERERRKIEIRFD